MGGIERVVSACARRELTRRRRCAAHGGNWVTLDASRAEDRMAAVESAWGRYPGYRVDLVPLARPGRVRLGDRVLAESDALPDRHGVGSRGAALLPGGVRGVGALRRDRPPHGLSLQGRGRLLDARRLGSAARERGLDLPHAARGGGRPGRARRVLHRSPRGRAGRRVPVGSRARGGPPRPAVGRRRRPAARAGRDAERRRPLRVAALSGSAASARSSRSCANGAARGS